MGIYPPRSTKDFIAYHAAKGHLYRDHPKPQPDPVQDLCRAIRDAMVVQHKAKDLHVQGVGVLSRAACVALRERHGDDQPIKWPGFCFTFDNIKGIYTQPTPPPAPVVVCLPALDKPNDPKAATWYRPSWRAYVVYWWRWATPVTLTGWVVYRWANPVYSCPARLP